MKKRARPLTTAEIAAVEDKAIDFSDIPELDADFWREAEPVEPDRTEQATLRIERSVPNHFRAPGKGYQTRINRVLESHVRVQGGSGGRPGGRSGSGGNRRRALLHCRFTAMTLRNAAYVRALDRTGLVRTFAAGTLIPVSG